MIEDRYSLMLKIAGFAGCTAPREIPFAGAGLLVPMEIGRETTCDEVYQAVHDAAWPEGRPDVLQKPLLMEDFHIQRLLMREARKLILHVKGYSTCHKWDILVKFVPQVTFFKITQGREYRILLGNEDLGALVKEPGHPAWGILLPDWAHFPSPLWSIRARTWTHLPQARADITQHLSRRT